MTRPANRRDALTLIEVLLVISIILILSAVAYPTLNALYGDIRIKGAADEVRGAWTEARAKAIEDGRAYRFSVQPNTGQYRVAPDSAEFWDGGSGGSGSMGMGSQGEDYGFDLPPLSREATLSDGILFETSQSLPSDGTWSTVVVFKPDGSCSSDTEVLLSESGFNFVLAVRVRAMTGAITITKQDREAGQ